MVLLRAGARAVRAELIAFDKDGTLVELHAPWGKWAESVADSLSGIVPQQILPRLGWNATTGRIEPETPLAIASPSTLQAVIATWLYDAGLGWSEAAATASQAVSGVGRPPAPPICEVSPLFEALVASGTGIAVITTDDRAGVEHDLGPLGIVPHIAAIVSGDTGLPTKPAPDMLLEACAAAGASPARTVVVGDSLADMLMGRAAKVALTVGVLSGSGTAETLAFHADVLVPTVCALACGNGN